MTRLSVNINKVATLRNARGTNMPDVIKVAQDCEKFGAEGITVHPRPDERHITKQDVYALKKVVTTEFNIEGYPDDRYLNIIRDISPAQATIVPDAPDTLTSDTGWDTIKYQDFLKDVISRLKENAGRVSVFAEARPEMIEAAAATGADRIELYTEPYASLFDTDPQKALEPYRTCARLAHKLGLGLNAGHDLNLYNLHDFYKNIPHLLEVSIGHALICDALYYGLENTIQLYKRQLG